MKWSDDCGSKTTMLDDWGMIVLIFSLFQRLINYTFTGYLVGFDQIPNMVASLNGFKTIFQSFSSPTAQGPRVCTCFPCRSGISGYNGWWRGWFKALCPRPVLYEVMGTSVSIPVGFSAAGLLFELKHATVLLGTQ